MYDECVICGNPGQYVVCIGDYHTALCQHHRNEFREYLMYLDITKERTNVKLSLMEFDILADHRLFNNSEIEEYRRLLRATVELDNKSFFVSKKWIEDNTQK
jgi:hypothetical protein